MKEKLLRLSLVLVVLMMTFASCEKEVIYVTDPSATAQGARTKGSDTDDRNGDRNGGTNQTNGKVMDPEIMQPALTPPANPGIIKAGETRSAGNITIANASRQKQRIVNLGFKFSGAGAAAVDSIFYTIRGFQEVKVKVVDNMFAINGIYVPVNTFTDIKLIYKLAKTVPSGIAEGSQITLSLNTFTTDVVGVNTPSSGTFPNPINLDRVSLIPNNDGGGSNNNGNGNGGSGNDDGNNPQATIIQTGWFSYLRTPALVAEKNTEADVMIHVIQLQMTGPGPARIRSIKFTNPYSAFNTVAGNDFKFMKDWGFDLNDRNRINFEVNVTNQNTFTVNFPVKDIPANGIYQRISIFAGVKNSGNRFDSGAFTHGKFGLKITSKSDIDIRDSAGNKIDLSKVNVWLDGTAIN